MSYGGQGLVDDLWEVCVAVLFEPAGHCYPEGGDRELGSYLCGEIIDAAVVKAPFQGLGQECGRGRGLCYLRSTGTCSSVGSWT